MCTLLWFAGSSSRKFTDHITTAITQLADLMQKPDWMVINVMSVHPGSLTTDSSELQGMFVIWMSSTLYWLVFVHTDPKPSPYRAGGSCSADTFEHTHIHTHMHNTFNAHVSTQKHSDKHTLLNGYLHLFSHSLCPHPQPLKTPVMKTRCLYSPRTEGSGSATQLFLPSSPWKLHKYSYDFFKYVTKIH